MEGECLGDAPRAFTFPPSSADLKQNTNVYDSKSAHENHLIHQFSFLLFHRLLTFHFIVVERKAWSSYYSLQSLQIPARAPETATSQASGALPGAPRLRCFLGDLGISADHRQILLGGLKRCEHGRVQNQMKSE